MRLRCFWRGGGLQMLGRPTMKTKILAAMALVTTSFAPLAIAPAHAAVPAAVQSAAEAKCLSDGGALPNSNWSYTAIPTQSGSSTQFVGFRVAGNNGFADFETSVTYSVECEAYNPGERIVRRFNATVSNIEITTESSERVCERSRVGTGSTAVWVWTSLDSRLTPSDCAVLETLLDFPEPA
jgi:hypothetical protein